MSYDPDEQIEAQKEIQRLLAGEDIETADLGVGQFGAGYLEICFVSGATLRVRTDDLVLQLRNGDEKAWLTKGGRDDERVAWKRSDSTR